MKGRDLFGVLVRVLGLIVILYAVWNLAFAVMFTADALHDTSFDRDFGAYYTFGVPALIVGIGLLRFARQIVRFSYSTNKDDSDA